MNNSEQLAKDLLQKVGEVSTETIQDMLTKAYEDGYRDGINYVQNPKTNGEYELVNLNLDLPSGTVWCRLKAFAPDMTLKSMIESGLKLPTPRQVVEFMNCKFGGDTFHATVLGLNGVNNCLKTNGPSPFAIIQNNKSMDSNFRIEAFKLLYEEETKELEWKRDEYFVGEKVRPLFVL